MSKPTWLLPLSGHSHVGFFYWPMAVFDINTN